MFRFDPDLSPAVDFAYPVADWDRPERRLPRSPRIQDLGLIDLRLVAKGDRLVRAEVVGLDAVSLWE